MIQNDDTISRQAAIDAFYEMASDIDHLCTVGDYVHVLEGLPSAQPEIIWCKDCKSLQKWRSEESAKKFGQIYECARGVFRCPKPEDFCSCAERRTDERSD